MAEFSLGLTKTAVEGTLSLVKSAVEEEKKLRENVQNDLVFITGEFEMMQSFLRVASTEREENEVELTWVRQLRNLAFDVEDCVEFVLHLDDDIKSRWGWLRRVWQTLYCRAPPLPLDVAVAEIKQLKARVEDVSQRNLRYNNLIRNSSNIPQGPPAEEPDSTRLSSTLFHILRDAWEASGKWCHIMCNLRELIAREGDDLHVISLGGGGDLGTTSIISNAYYDPEICESFTSRAWVKLTHPFNHDEFVKSLLTQLCSTSVVKKKLCSTSHQANTGVNFWTRMEAEATEGNLMKAELVQQMREEKYLVVLQDVFMSQDWDVIRTYLPDNNKGSRIVVSTPLLRIALLCTGEPYQVSELTQFSDGRFICAWFKKMPSTMDCFKRQLQRRGGVISMWAAGNDDDSTWGAGCDVGTLVDIMYKGIINQLKEFDGIKYERHSWVDVPDPFDLKVFTQRLFLNFYSDDIRSGEIMVVGKKGGEGLIERCRRFLFEEDCVVVINGLRCRDDWDQIERTFLLSSSEEPSSRTTKGCILVVTDEETVAMHCVKFDHAAVLRVKDLKADTTIVGLIRKGTWYCELGGNKGRLFYDRRNDATQWADSVHGCYYTRDLLDGKSGLVTVSGNKIADVVRLKAFLRSVYYQDGVDYHNGQKFSRRSWVDLPQWKDQIDVPDPFNLRDFSWRLLLDFYSDDPQAKETIAVDLMEGTIIDPIEKCREFLRNEKCLVVIHGRRWFSTFHLKFISRKLLLSGHIQGTIIVDATNDFMRTYESLAHQCNPTNRIEAKHVGYVDAAITKEYYRLFFCKSERRQKAEECSEEFQLVGRQMEEDDLKELVHNSRVVSVWGIAGVGKSSLVTKVYYKMLLSGQIGVSPCKQFGWVDVPDPFNLTQLCCRLLVDFYSDDPQAKETAAVGLIEGSLDPIQECCKFIHKQTCLVVIDGLRSTQDWDLIKATLLLPVHNNRGTTIVVITSAEKVAMHCVQNVQHEVLNIRRLEADAALHLLTRKITSEETVVPKFIVDKCGGLPKVIASIEACYSSYYMLQSLRDNFMGTLETHPEFHGLRPLLSWMQSYFDACSDSIKPCIFYLSIFSAEKNIRLRRLLWRWIAEGYCRDTSDRTTYEENGENFVSELVKLSIIQKLPSSKVFCQINGFFHEYIISRTMEDNLVFALEGRCSLNSTRAGQHLTIRSSWDRNKIVYESIDFSRLRSLTVFGKWESFFICSKKVNMRLLRVLDLEDATDVTNEDLDKIAKLLTRLKFLSLRGCRGINCLPSSMGGLRQLQTLDIRGTSIVTLPLFITKLEKLRYIRAGTTTTEAWDWEVGNVVLTADADGEEEDRASSSTLTAEADGEEEDRASSSTQVVTNLPPPAAAAAAAATPTEGGTDSTAPVLPPVAVGTPVSRNNLVSSLLSKLCRSGGWLDNNGSGVKVPAGIQKLAVLHTLGVVNVNVTSSAKSMFFEELKKLTQLRKLGVSGINKGNIKEFCEAICDHAHLKSLSLELDKDDNLDGLDDIPQPPKSLQSLKLYGHVIKLLLSWLAAPPPATTNTLHWIGQLGNSNLKKLKFDLTIEKPEELRALEFSAGPAVGHVRIRPIQGGDLDFWALGWKFARVLEIQCSSILNINFGVFLWEIEVLKVHFCGGSQSSLHISGLSNLRYLREVWLKGYTDAHKQYMLQQINEMRLPESRARPVLKLVQTRSSS